MFSFLSNLSKTNDRASLKHSHNNKTTREPTSTQMHQTSIPVSRSYHPSSMENRGITSRHLCFKDWFFKSAWPGDSLNIEHHMVWLAKEREDDLAAAIAATLDKVCVWEGRNKSFRHPVVKVCTWVCFWTDKEASFCKKQWNMITLLQANHCTLLSGCTMQSSSKSKATDLASYTPKMSSNSDLHEGKREVCVCGVWGEKFFLIKSRL